MKIAIMQPYFFPYIGYWQLIKAVDKYIIYDDVNYIKNGWINRNCILFNSNRKIFTLPLNGASPFRRINETRITEDAVKKHKLLKTIEQAYSKSPFYKNVFLIVEEAVMNESKNISSANTVAIKRICAYLELETEIVLSSSLKKDNDLKAQDKVIHIVSLLGGDTYINAIGGRELYNKKDFINKGIELKFIKSNPVTYRQFNDDFVPSLSIIDVMMFNSPERINKMLDDYELI